jgi:hypothetical protein
MAVQVNQMSNDFGIRVRSEAVAFQGKSRADFFVILDNPVVDHRQPVLADMGMGIALRGHAVGGPARVRDAELPVYLRPISHFGERRDPPDTSQSVQAVIDHGEARGVITPVFELAQALEQYGHNIPLRDGSDDSTHD